MEVHAGFNTFLPKSAVLPGIDRNNFSLGTFMLQFFHNSTDYLPIYAAPYCYRCIDSADHPWAIKMTLINVKSPDCEQAFRFSQYFQR